MKGNIWLLPKTTKKKHWGFQKRAVSFLDECVFLPGCRATGGKWLLHHSFGSPALSLTLSFMFFSDQAEKHECKKGKQKKKKMEMIFWASLQLSRDLFHHLSCLLGSVFRAYARSWEHSVLHLRLLSGALLGQVLMDFSVILKIKITGDVVERRAHYTWAAITFNWVSVMPQVIVCICIFII